MSKRQTDELSAVLALDSAHIRLVHLGLYELRGAQRDIVPAEQERLLARLAAADNVLSDRGWIRSCERQLCELDGERPSAGGPSRQPLDGDSVQVRLRLEDLRLAARGLQAFLERENPTEDAFRRGALVDPPQKVRPVLKRFEQAREMCERQQTLAERESALLD